MFSLPPFVAPSFSYLDLGADTFVAVCSPCGPLTTTPTIIRCWGGRSCKYLASGYCRFWHPTDHIEEAQRRHDNAIKLEEVRQSSAASSLPSYPPPAEPVHRVADQWAARDQSQAPGMEHSRRRALGIDYSVDSLLPIQRHWTGVYTKHVRGATFIAW